MTDHVTALIQQAEQLCQTSGLRLTPTRRRVLELIAAMPGGAKAYDILDLLTRENPSARPPTIYRALDFLMAHGFIHRIESLNAYVSCSCPHHVQAFQLLICDECGDVQEVHDQSINTHLDRVAKDFGFAARRKTIELHGLCSACQQEDCPSC